MRLNVDTLSDENNAAAHRARILGEHISSYMQTLLDEDEDAYKRQFATYKKEGIMPDMIEGMYTKVWTELNILSFLWVIAKDDRKCKDYLVNSYYIFLHTYPTQI